MSEFGNIGVAAIITLMLLDRVIPLLKPKLRNGHQAGDQSVEFWRQQQQEMMASLLMPVLKNQMDLLKELVTQGTRQYELSLKQGFIMQELREAHHKEPSS